MKGHLPSTLLSLIAIALSLTALVQLHRADAPDRVLEVRGLRVKDAAGVTRVEIGAPVQDPMVLGERGPRAAPASGVVLNGPDGNERGGYLTVDAGDEAVLTLDAAATGQEVFKVVANKDAGASLFVIHQNGAAAMLTTYQGQPELRLYDENGTQTWSQPAAGSGEPLR